MFYFYSQKLIIYFEISYNGIADLRCLRLQGQPGSMSGDYQVSSEWYMLCDLTSNRRRLDKPLSCYNTFKDWKGNSQANQKLRIRYWRTNGKIPMNFYNSIYSKSLQQMYAEHIVLDTKWIIPNPSRNFNNLKDFYICGSNSIIQLPGLCSFPFVHLQHSAQRCFLLLCMLSTIMFLTGDVRTLRTARHKERSATPTTTNLFLKVINTHFLLLIVTSGLIKGINCTGYKTKPIFPVSL